MRLITEANGETIQIHGANAVRLIGLSTQMPVNSIFYTSGRTRDINVGNSTVRLQHMPEDRFQHAKNKVGVALTALHYVGKNNLSIEIVTHVKKALSKDEFIALQACKMPSWMKNALSLVTR
jgi:hypothetical protein